jgi:hypothetical protein
LPKDSIVLIYRDPSINRCRFLEAGAVAASILEKCRQSLTPYTDLIKFAVSAANSDPQSVIADFLSMVEHLQANNLFLGNKSLNS